MSGERENLVSSRLADMMALDAADPVWRPDELGAILAHQLSLDLAFDLSSLGPTAIVQLQPLPPGPRPRLKEVLADPHPPLELLIRLKQFAKACRGHPRAALPPEVATVLYFAALAAATLRCHQSITQIGDAGLQHGAQWALAQPWLDAVTRSLFQEVLAIKAGGTAA